MSMEDLFGGVDISDLANSEEAIIEGSKTPAKKDEGGTPPEKKDNKNIPDNTLSIEDIANIGDEEEEEDDSSLNNDNKKKAPESNGGQTTPSSQSALTSLAKVLHESGVLSSLNEEDIEKISDVNSLVDTIASQIKSNELADMTDEQKEYVAAMRDGVSHSNFVQRKSNAEQYKNLKDEVIEKAPQLGFELIKRSLIVQGVNEERAIKLATKSINDEDGFEEALLARDFLVKHEEDSLRKEIEDKKLAKQNEIKEAQLKIDTLKSKINETSEILPGIKVNSQTRDKIFSSMTTPVDAKGETLLNEVMDMYSKNMEYKMKIHALHTITKGFTDFSKFKTTASTSAIKELEEKLQSTTKTPSGGFGNKHNSMGGGATSKQFVDALPDFNKNKK